MYSRSPRFDAAVQDSHDVAFRVALWSPGMRNLIADDLDVTGGSVTASRTATHRRSCSVTLVDRDGILARTFSSQQAVPPVELVISRGIDYSDGTQELIPLGVFGVSTVDPDRQVVFTLTGYDRSRRVARQGFDSTHIVQPGTPFVEALADLVRGGLTFPLDVQNLSSSTAVTLGPVAFLVGDDRWAKARILAQAAGCEIFFDQRGDLIIQDEPQGMLQSPLWQYIDDENSILLPETKQTISDDPGYNAVFAEGNSTSNEGSAPSYLAYDGDPASPTYYFGDYGKVIESYSDSNITDNDAAERVAHARLRKHLGRNDSMSLATVPHPAQEAGDVVRVRIYGRDTLMIVDSVQMPLDVETAASLSCRAQFAPEVTA